VLEHGPQQADPRAQPIGLVLMAVGFIGFVLGLCGGRRDGGTPAQPELATAAARLGRGGGQLSGAERYAADCCQFAPLGSSSRNGAS
jgi:hypothetical protein